MKRNDLKKQFYKETPYWWKDKDGKPTIQYVNWLEDKIKQLQLGVVSQQRELFLELLEFIDNDLEQTTCEWLNEQFVDEFINSKNCG